MLTSTAARYVSRRAVSINIHMSVSLSWRLGNIVFFIILFINYYMRVHIQKIVNIFFHFYLMKDMLKAKQENVNKRY